ncbi:MAG TPA: hypothetical protein VKG02_22865, partial [Blastocatellia bacterium]|nr:hypothetical protein [Blastocatellia bacterium]
MGDLVARQSGGRNPVGRIQADPAYYAPTDLRPAIVEIYWRYENEPPNAARLIGRYLPGQPVSFAFTPSVNQRVILSTVSVSGSGVRSVAKLRDAPEFIVDGSGITPGDAAADGVTKGIATFTATDFDDDGNGKISIDYLHGQAATSSHQGFLSPADWSTFAGKQNALGYVPLNPSRNLSDVASVPSSRVNLGLGGFYFLQPLIPNNTTFQCLAVAGNGIGSRAHLLVIVNGASAIFECLGADNRTR